MQLTQSGYSHPLQLFDYTDYGNNNFTVGQGGYNGVIDELSLWDVELTPQQIQQMYDMGNP